MLADSDGTADWNDTMAADFVGDIKDRDSLCDCLATVTSCNERCEIRALRDASRCVNTTDREGEQDKTIRNFPVVLTTSS